MNHLLKSMLFVSSSVFAPCAAYANVGELPPLEVQFSETTPLLQPLPDTSPTQAYATQLPAPGVSDHSQYRWTQQTALPALPSAVPDAEPVVSVQVTTAGSPISVHAPASLTAQAPSTQSLPDTNPNRDRFTQPAAPLVVPEIPQSSPPQNPLSAPTPVPGDSEQSVLVQDIQVTGSSIFAADDLESIIQPLRGQQATLAELQAVADQITQLYVNQGYLTSRALLPAQAIENGQVQIQVIEGSIEEIQVEGLTRLNQGYVRDRIKRGTQQPLSNQKLEEQLRLLRTDPLFSSVEASLRSGTQPGQSILVVRATEADRFRSVLSLDNYTPPSIAPERASVALSYQNLSGTGDELSVFYGVGTNFGDFARAASNTYDIAYRIPLNPLNGTLQLRTTISNSRITQPSLANFGIEAESESYEVSFRQPVIRSIQQELAVSLGFLAQGGQTFIFNNTPFPFGLGPDANGVSRTRVLKFGQDYVRRDTAGAWLARSQFNFGIDVLDATVNPSPTPDGQFFSWLFQGQRLQRLNKDDLLILQADLQYSPDNLLSTNQFVIGGGQSVRGFRQNARSGDNGFRLSVEGRFPVVQRQDNTNIFTLAPFFDVGQVWNNGSNPNGPVANGLLAGVGMGLVWQPIERLSVRVDYALPLVDIGNRGQSLQDDGLFFSIVLRP